jgi:hypothetical protein
VPEFIDPVFVKTSPKRLFSIIENERIGLAFKKTGSIISGTNYVFGTDPDRNRVTWETPNSEAIPSVKSQ